MLSAANQQVITAFDDLGLTPEQIAEQFDMDIVAIKATLMQFSSKFRSLVKKDPENYDFKDDELAAANETIIELMRHAEDEHLRGRMARYVRDDKKGRLDQINSFKNLNMNIIMFNDRMEKARIAKERSKAQLLPPPPETAPAGSEQKPIDVEEVKAA